MKEKNTVYYLIRERILAKREAEGNHITDYLFRDGKWAEDSGHAVMDRLMGYDPSEPEESPYRFGSTDILMEMEEISREQAAHVMNQQILDVLKPRWAEMLAAEKEEWKKKPWPAKLVEIQYKLNGVKFSLLPADIGLSDDCWDQGFMESVQPDLGNDLKKYGATDVYYFGFLD